MIRDTRVFWTHRTAGNIGGYLLPYGGPGQLFIPHGINTPSLRFYVSPRTQLEIAPMLYVNVNHGHEEHGNPGFVGMVTDLIQDPNGWRCECALFQHAGGFSIDGVALPMLIDTGRLYYCCELSFAPCDVASDGELLRTYLSASTLTTTPALVTVPTLEDA